MLPSVRAASPVAVPAGRLLPSCPSQHARVRPQRPGPESRSSRLPNPERPIESRAPCRVHPYLAALSQASYRTWVARTIAKEQEVGTGAAELNATLHDPASMIRQWHDVLPPCLHAFGRNRPWPILQIDLRPNGAPRLPRSRGGRDEEFQRQPPHRFRIGVDSLGRGSPENPCKCQGSSGCSRMLGEAPLVDRAGFEPAYGNPGRFTVCCL